MLRMPAQPTFREWANWLASGRTGCYPGAMTRLVGTLKWPRSGRSRELIVVLLAGVYLGLLGPFGNYLVGDPPTRIVYWTASLLAGSLMLSAAYGACRAVARPVRLAPWLCWGLAVVAAAALAALLSNAVAVRLWPQVGYVAGTTWFFQVLITFVPLAFVKGFLQRSSGRSPPPLHRHLVTLADEPVDCVTIEDHYVRVHGRASSRLLYGTFRDALAELEGRDGLQVHRSWWVSRAALERVVVDGRRVELVLRNGLTVPVARSSIARLKTAGWITDPAAPQRETGQASNRPISANAA